MSAVWQAIADSLRSELAEYGRLLGLYEEQQTLLFKRDAAGVLRVSDMIDGQLEVVLECRRNRDDATSGFAGARGLPESSRLCSLLPLIAEEAQPLLRALISDANRMVARLRRISRHNRLFLIRTIDIQQDLLRRFRPGCFTKTYSPTGRVSVASTGHRALAAEV